MLRSKKFAHGVQIGKARVIELRVPSSGCQRSGTNSVRHPARLLARRPFGESSITVHSAAGLPS